MARMLIRAPDHLGDGVQALPAVAALARAHEVSIEGPSWCPSLYGHLGASFGRRGDEEIAVLLKPSFRAAWRVRSIQSRIGLASTTRSWLLDVAVPPRNGHRTLDYAAICEAAGVTSLDAPRVPAPDPLPELPTLPDGAVLLLPGTRSARTVRWRGFRALAEALGPRAVFAAGPGDLPDIRETVPEGALLVAPVDVPMLIALAIRATAVVGLDSGLTHLAAAARRGAGLTPDGVHVVYGSTDPARTGPPGTTPHSGTRPPCWPCYGKRCPIGGACLDADVTTVLSALV